MSLDFSLETGRCQTCGRGEEEVFTSNITHNVVPMWRLAGVYRALYKSQGQDADSIIPTLKAGLKHMEANRKDHEKLNPSNGWGDYEGALNYLKRVLEACEEFPDAKIRISA